LTNSRVDAKRASRRSIIGWFGGGNKKKTKRLPETGKDR